MFLFFRRGLLDLKKPPVTWDPGWFLGGFDEVQNLHTFFWVWGRNLGIIKQIIYPWLDFQVFLFFGAGVTCNKIFLWQMPGRVQNWALCWSWWWCQKIVDAGCKKLVAIGNNPTWKQRHLRLGHMPPVSIIYPSCSDCTGFGGKKKFLKRIREQFYGHHVSGFISFIPKCSMGQENIYLRPALKFIP